MEAPVLSRYLTREIYYSLFAFLGIFLLLLSTNYLIHFLEDAASGAGTTEIAIKLLILLFPQMVGVLLPVSLFLAILSVLGKLFAQNELLIALSSGMSFQKIWWITQRPTFLVMAVTAVITLFIEPQMTYYQNSIRNSMASGNASLTLVQSGQFVSMNGGNEVIYLGGHTKNNALVSNVFVSLSDPETGTFKIITAPKGHSYIDTAHGGTFMVLENGFQYQGKTPTVGQAAPLDYGIVSFGSYGIRMPSTIAPDAHPSADAVSTRELLRQGTSRAWGELEWRIAIPIVAWVLALFAVGLSYIKPRQGRFGKFLPALMIFIIYFNVLVASRAWIDVGIVPPWLGLWWAHAVFALAAWALLMWRDGALFGVVHRLSRWGRSS